MTELPVWTVMLRVLVLESVSVGPDGTTLSRVMEFYVRLAIRCEAVAPTKDRTIV